MRTEKSDIAKCFGVVAWLLALAICQVSAAAEPASFEALDKEYVDATRPLMARFCLDCHATADPQGELDLERFAKVDQVRTDTKVWLKVAEMLDNGEMPPKDADQPTAAERKQLRTWVGRYLDAEAYASAGDPGPVVLRRLSNAEYTYTLGDLTGVPLDPAREFPPDNAAGEGFTNAGAAMVMSPALLSKYLDAAKQVADHAVLLPDGFRFFVGTTPRDWTDETLAKIRQTYMRHSEASVQSEIHLHGLTWDNREGGKLPLDKYLGATLAERDALTSGSKSIAEVAKANGLNAKYLASLWKLLHEEQPSQLIGALQARWGAAKPADAVAMAAELEVWQKALTRFQSVGHMKSWMAPVNPVAARQDFRLKIAQPTSGNEVIVYLGAGTAGDASTNDLVVWEQPRLVTPGRPDLPLSEVRAFAREMTARRERIFAATAKALLAVDEASRSGDKIDPAALAAKHGIDVELLSPWLEYFGLRSGGEHKLDLFSAQIKKVSGYDYVQGWGTAETPQLITNASDGHVRVPGNMKPHAVAVHPAPTLNVAAGWRSPIAGTVEISGQVTHAHPECGNGVTWTVELRRGSTRQALAGGVAQGATPVAIQQIPPVAVQPGDLVSLVIGARDGNHGCDLTDIELSLTSVEATPKKWNLNADIAGDVLAGNPHADKLGNAGVWHFYTEVAGASQGPSIPAGSILARWQAAQPGGERAKLAESLGQMLTTAPPADAAHPDAVLYRQLASLGGPLFAGARVTSKQSPAGDPANDTNANWGVDPALFGHRPDGSPIDPNSLCVAAPNIIEVRLPADLVVGSELVTAATLDASASPDASAQGLVQVAKPDGLTMLRPDSPVLTAEGSAARQRFATAFDEFRQWFPAALCYIRIVPVDEVVTLTLFHREDEPLQRLMLDDAERARLDQLWHELHFVSQDALTLVDAFTQLMEFATQDSDPKLFEPYRIPIHEAAAAFRQELIDTQPRQVAALVEFATRVYRRPLLPNEADELRTLYARLREQELPHDEAFRFVLARMLVSPSFLYRLERAPDGKNAGPVNDFELANRLSYFLWSSQPDDKLNAAAAAGRLHDPEVLAAEARRMVADGRVRRLATEFACQWLHIYDFATLDEKSERHFPTFVELRGDMYEEPIRYFTDLFQRDGSVLEIFDADHTFVNEKLAGHYAMTGVSGPEWRRVEGLHGQSRGGLLGFAAVLAKQSGASRTSPILRGNWISEVLLGEKLPRPPKDVPVLPDDESATADLTVRQLVERHTSDVKCSGCHARIDPLGYALEGFDAIGRRRDKDLANRPIDVQAKLQDGAEFADLAGLRAYLLTQRREAVVRQFCKKLLGYALGRGVQLSDHPLIDEMTSQLASHDYRFSAALETIVRSQQFREIRGREAPLADAH